MQAISLLGPGFLVALGCAGVMGYAIQRGATCMLFAVREMLCDRRTSRLVALLEASCWVAGGLLLARVVGGLTMTPSGHAITAETLAGGALLGLGALVNGACVFGAIARLGSGEWAYALTPLGFFLGCLTVPSALAPLMPATALAPSRLFDHAWLLAPFAAFAALRLFEALFAARHRRLAAHVWSPHHATAVIGLAFVVMFLTVGAWAYTETLAALSRGMAEDLPINLLLLAGLLAGTFIGGWTAGRWQLKRPTMAAMSRCVAGGFLMGCGSLLVPGGNDGLVLVGLPLLQPYAWAAVGSMAAAIVVGLLVERRLAW